MITLLGNESLPHISKVSFAVTSCLLTAFNNSTLSPEVWVQKEDEKITAVISRFGGRVNLCFLGGNIEEIREFLAVIGFSELFCEAPAALALGFKDYNTFKVLRCKTQKKKDFVSPVGLNPLYEGLSFGSDSDIELPPFEVFAPDVSHRLRHGGALGIVEDFGAALAFCGNKLNVINGIAVKKSHRKKGLGQKLLNRILEVLDGDVFALATANTSEFYIKNGFEDVGTAVIIRG